MNAGSQSVRSDIRIAALVPRTTLLGKILAVTGPALDRLLGIRAVRRLYEENRLAGIEAREFSRRVVECLGVDVVVHHANKTSIPVSGPVLVVCNHPYGGIEAIVLVHELLKVRSDVKVLGNTALRIVRELSDVMIYTNPLVSSQRNLGSIRQASSQLKNGGVLLIFPAGRVSYFRKDLGRTTDHDWNRIVGHLIAHSSAAVVPTFIDGFNSRMFIALGFIYSRLKILLLPREMLKLNNKQVGIYMAQPIKNLDFSTANIDQSTRVARLMTYLQGVKKTLPASQTSADRLLPLAKDPDSSVIDREIAKLPGAQVLLTYRDFVVCFASQNQVPETVHEIARQRERTFRLFDEGSGQPIDGDSYDRHYVHLFAWDTKQRKLLGAYRIGQTDLLRESGKVYLSQMFDISDAFYEENEASLELGRSFVTPDYQKNHYSLHLLWRGIGAYLQRHPRYDRLYGTVSLSRQYDLRSTCVICEALIEPTKLVSARNPLDTDLGPEWDEYKNKEGALGLKQISMIVRNLENGERDLPVLLRHYHKVGAKFLAVGIDRNFNNTPGLMLSVDINNMPKTKRKLYLGKR